MRTHLECLGAILLGAVLGCGQSPCSVSGKVLVNGAPVEDGRIALRPTTADSGTRTARTTIENGVFEFARAQGLQPGDYSVVITALRKTGKQLPPEAGSGEVLDQYEQFLPARYNTDTKLTCEVIEDSENLSFELKVP
jgi:hypothetical protein